MRPLDTDLGAFGVSSSVQIKWKYKTHGLKKCFILKFGHDVIKAFFCILMPTESKFPLWARSGIFFWEFTK